MENATETKLPLSGKKIGILVEHKFIPEEINAYRFAFDVLGAEVEFISRLWYADLSDPDPDKRPKSVVFYSDVDPLDSQPWETPQPLRVCRDVSYAINNLSEYAALIMSANYTSVRLRHSTQPVTVDSRKLVQSSPVVQLFAKAMARPDIIKGALCHGLWILTPNPHLLKGRKVVCNLVIMADILNCGADAVCTPKVIVDGDLVTGYSKHEVIPFIQAIASQIK